MWVVASGACGDDAPSPVPPAALACGTIRPGLYVRETTPCEVDRADAREHNDTASLSTLYSRDLTLSDRVYARLRAACDPVRRTLTIEARTSHRCGSGCEGSNARATPRWEGALSLPSAAPRWRVRFVIDRTHTKGVFDGEGRHVCDLVVPTAGRTLAIDAEHLERVLQLPAGDAPLSLVCPSEPNPLAGGSCYGVTDARRAFDEARAERASTLRIRIEATPE